MFHGDNADRTSHDANLKPQLRIFVCICWFQIYIRLTPAVSVWRCRETVIMRHRAHRPQLTHQRGMERRPQAHHLVLQGFDALSSWWHRPHKHWISCILCGLYSKTTHPSMAKLKSCASKAVAEQGTFVRQWHLSVCHLSELQPLWDHCGKLLSCQFEWASVSIHCETAKS